MTNIYRNTERRKGDMNDYRHMRDQVLELQNTANIIQIFNKKILEYRKELYENLLSDDYEIQSFDVLMEEETAKLDASVEWVKHHESNMHQSIMNIYYHANHCFTGDERRLLMDAAKNLLLADLELYSLAFNGLIEYLDKKIGDTDHTPLKVVDLKNKVNKGLSKKNKS